MKSSGLAKCKGNKTRDEPYWVCNMDTHITSVIISLLTHKYPMECAVAIECVECDIESNINISVSQIDVEPKESRPTAEHRAATSTDMNISLA